MKPHRMRMVHDLVVNYGLFRKMEVIVRIVPTSLLLCDIHRAQTSYQRPWTNTDEFFSVDRVLGGRQPGK